MGDLDLFYQFWEKWTADKVTQILYICSLNLFIMPLADFLLFFPKNFADLGENVYSARES